MQTPFPPQPPPTDYRLAGDGGWPIGTIIAWIVILVSTAIIGVGNFSKGDAQKTGTLDTHVSLTIEMMGRYCVALHTKMPADKPDLITPDMLKTLGRSADTPVDKLAAIPIVAEVQGEKAARDQLAAMNNLPKNLISVRHDLNKIYSEHPQDLSGVERQEMIDRLGWCGKIATVFHRPATDPERASVLASADHTLALMVGASAGVVGALLAGGVLLVFFLVRRADRRLALHFQPPHVAGGPFVEAFAIYVGTFALMALSERWIARHIPAGLQVRLAVMVLPTLFAIIWPLLRGVNVRAWRGAIGWHGGQGPLREVTMGFIGYLAGLPILALGLLVTTYLIKVANAHPSHPIEKMLGIKNISAKVLVYFLASLYAPITEETMFRGALFSGLRIRHGWLVTTVLTSFLFAAIHPQGWTTIPVLMSIAIVLAGIREWRGTILASATAHCIHNSLIVTFAIVAMQ